MKHNMPPSPFENLPAGIEIVPIEAVRAGLDACHDRTQEQIDHLLWDSLFSNSDYEQGKGSWSGPDVIPQEVAILHDRFVQLSPPLGGVALLK